MVGYLLYCIFSLATYVFLYVVFDSYDIMHSISYSNLIKSNSMTLEPHKISKSSAHLNVSKL